MIAPASVHHADWSVDPAKRWIASAEREGPGYRVRSVERVADDPLRAGPAGHELLGVDFPIGLPLAYAAAVGIDRFGDALASLGDALLPQFFEVAGSAAEISLGRPFYPARPGPAGTVRRRHLADGLGIGFSDLLRRCERPFAGRPAAAALFWLVGSQQVGRAAIHGWRTVLQPARRARRDVALWPFDGDLGDLIARHELTVAEAYPAESARQFGFGRAGWSKRRQADRRRVGLALIEWARRHDVAFDDGVLRRVLDGFGPAAGGEDAFDATVGLFGLLRVAAGVQREFPPTALGGDVGSVEGWILGQDASA
ncbi:MAG TPA: hypothetical protein VN781_10230 [Acidimicrobiales bacterium]|nr:hypothetical protein [Acidimicrobiales bacterium]